MYLRELCVRSLYNFMSFSRSSSCRRNAWFGSIAGFAFRMIQCLSVPSQKWEKKLGTNPLLGPPLTATKCALLACKSYVFPRRKYVSSNSKNCFILHWISHLHSRGMVSIPQDHLYIVKQQIFLAFVAIAHLRNWLKNTQILPCKCYISNKPIELVLWYNML